jgi:hypothetical protein
MLENWQKITMADLIWGSNPQVIHNVDKKVSYRGCALAKLVPKRFKNT